MLNRDSARDEGGFRYPGLSAKIHPGWVTAFRVRYPARGD
jgi:hypothetical protein